MNQRVVGAGKNGKNGKILYICHWKFIEKLILPNKFHKYNAEFFNLIHGYEVGSESWGFGVNENGMEWNGMLFGKRLRPAGWYVSWAN